MAKKSPLQIHAEYAATRLIFGFFSLLPRRLALAVSIGFARLGYLFLGKLRKVGMRNLEIVFPDKTEAERKRILKASFDNLGRMLAEFSQFPRVHRQDIIDLVEFDPEVAAAYDAEKAKGRGVILATPHLGNWEVGVIAYSAIRRPMHYMARPLDNPLIERMVTALRGKFGNQAIDKTNSLYKAMSVLRRGGTLGILPDVNVQEKDGVFVPFFGIPACTTSGVAMLARRAGAIIIPTCTVWNAAVKKYDLIRGKTIEPVLTDNRQQDIIETTAAMSSAMEDFVRAYPEQWLWIHKRWNTRPAGEPSLY